MARNYKQAKIYCIKVNTEEEYLPYVGSSCKRLLSQRMNQHRCSYKRWKEGKNERFVSSFTLFEKYGIEECFIELIEIFPCNCNDELRKKEREWIEKMKCVNIVKRVIITEEEIAERKKIYREEHKEQIAEKGKETFTCNCGSVCRKSEKVRHERSLKHQNFITDKNKTELLYKLEEERIELLNKILELSNNSS
jgi:hypothetical protein